QPATYGQPHPSFKQLPHSRTTQPIPKTSPTQRPQHPIPPYPSEGQQNIAHNIKLIKDNNIMNLKTIAYSTHQSQGQNHPELHNKNLTNKPTDPLKNLKDAELSDNESSDNEKSKKTLRGKKN
ncbi:hypothetical protein PFMG_02762, partial [Plasmodium falciparum IGH-CR14]